ncbi:MAG: PTS glucose transporter subunit IIA [Lachnospiraceae bacterium]|nr:PTS glucose transporter subunit IIA [Lachnospiraceae bacterium]
MITVKIQYHDMRDAAEIVREISNCAFDVKIVCGTETVNGKSLLGVVSLGVDKEIEVQMDTDNVQNAKPLMEVLRKYCLNGANGKKKKMNEVYSPLDGRIALLSEAGDEIFAKELLGNGVAIYPDSENVYSPVNGKIFFIFPTQNAIGIQTADGTEIMLHVGTDAIQRNQGKDFDMQVKEGQEVKTGDLLLSFNRKELEGKGYDTVTFLLFINKKMTQLQILRGGNVKKGEKIIEMV